MEKQFPFTHQLVIGALNVSRTTLLLEIKFETLDDGLNGKLLMAEKKTLNKRKDSIKSRRIGSWCGGDLALAIALVLRGFVRQWHVPNVQGNSWENLFKNAKGRLFILLFVQRYLFF